MIGRRDRRLGCGAAAPSIRVLGLVIAATLATGSASGARQQAGATLRASPLNIGLRVELRPSLAVLRVEAELTFEAHGSLDEVVFRLRPDLQLDVVEDDSGIPLYYERARNLVVVQTPRLTSGTISTWKFRYRMRLAEPPGASGQVVSVTPWYPHFRYPTIDAEIPRNVPMRSTVSATLEEPWMIVAAGSLESSGEGDLRTHTWRDAIPSPVVPLLIARLEQQARTDDRSRQLRAFFPVASRSPVATYLDYMVNVVRFYTEILGPHRRTGFNVVGLDLPDRVAGLSAPGVTVMPSPHAASEAPFPYRIFAHEVAHHWWNDSASVPLRADAWLREGLPTYSSLLFLQRHYGVAMFRQELDRTRRVALSVDAPVSLAASFGAADPEAAYGLNYHKAAFVLHMLRKVIGAGAFRDLLRESHTDGPGLTATRFATNAEALHGDDLSWFFAAWVQQARIPRFAIRFDQRRVADNVSPFLLTVSIEQQEADIRHPVLLRVLLEGAPPVERTVWVEPGTVSFSIALPSPVRELEFDPFGDLLHRGATVERVNARLP